MKSKQHVDPLLMELKELVLINNNESFSQGEYWVLMYQGRLCVRYVDCLRERIKKEAHVLRYSFHFGATKIYQYLREIY